MSTDPKPAAPAAPAAAPAPVAAAPAPAPKPTHVTLEIDGRSTTVPVGTNLVDAAETVGVDIPYYCYHKGLSIAANCRMCMVTVSNAPPGKLVPACQTPAVEGQKVDTQSHNVKEQQRAVLEFLLVHHPVDCSICDQAGECKLQDYYAEYDHRPSRFDMKKWLKNKRKVLGPLIVLDQERCIMCTRCVRFMKEVAGDPALGVFGRGTREVIDVFPGRTLDHAYAGNVVDLCPVGALLSRDMRFRARSYFLSAAPTICTGCSRGCNTYVDHFQNVPYRYRPRENMDVNKYWMCDDGRATVHGLQDDRLEHAALGRGDGAKTIGVAEAARLSASALSGAGKGGLAVVLSPHLSIEELAALLQVVNEGLQLGHVYVSGNPDGVEDQLLRLADKNPNRKGLEALAKGFGLNVKPFSEFLAGAGSSIKAALVVGGQLPADAEKVAAALGKLDVAIVASANATPWLSAATLRLPLGTHLEDDGSFLNGEGDLQRFSRAFPLRGEARPGWAWAVALGRELGLSLRFDSAKSVFAAHAGLLGDASKGFDWVKAAPASTTRGLTPLQGGTVDGRPPGWRELVPLKTASLVPGTVTGGN